MKSFKTAEAVPPESIVRVFGASIANPKIYNGEYARVRFVSDSTGKVSKNLVNVDFGNEQPFEVFHFRQLRTI